MADPPKLKYAAFISYSHSDLVDRKFVEWFQPALENYRTPAALVNHLGLFGPIKSRIGQVFRDVQDLSATPDLASTIRDAIDNSAALIVVCSPEAAKSRWVDREVAYFKQAHSDRPILAVILRGVRHSAEEPFPESLRQRFEDADPFGARHFAEPLAPDMQKEDRSTIKLRVLAALLGVPFDALFQREHRRWRNRVAIAATAALTAIAILSATTIFALISRQQARAQAVANAAYAYSDRDPTVALRLAREAMTINYTTTAQVAALRAFNMGSWYYGVRIDGAWDAALSADETKLAWIEGGSRIRVRDLQNGKEQTWGSDSDHVAFSSGGDVIAWKGWSGPGTRGSFRIWDRAGALRKEFNYEFLDAVDCGGDKFVVPAFKDDGASTAGPNGILLHLIDATSGEEQTLGLPDRDKNSAGAFGWNLSLLLACNPGATLMVLVQPLLLSGAVVRKDREPAAFAVPDNFSPLDLDLSSDGKHFAIFLRSDRVGMIDSVGLMDLTTAGAPALRVVPLAEAPTQPAGGEVRFVDDERVFVASTEGWNRLVDVSTGSVTTLPSKQRAADVIAIDRATGGFAIARRSGSVTIYDKTSFPVSRLVGNPPSDGLYPEFRKLVFSPSGAHLLTVSRAGARVWTRPSYPVVAAAPLGQTLDTGLPPAFLNEFATKSVVEETIVAKGCRDPLGVEVNRTIDDFGSISLCFTWNGREESLPTGLTKSDFAPRRENEIETAHGVAYWSNENYVRMFSLDPERVMNFVDHTSGIWVPDPDRLSQLVVR